MCLHLRHQSIEIPKKISYCRGKILVIWAKIGSPRCIFRKIGKASTSNILKVGVWYIHILKVYYISYSKHVWFWTCATKFMSYIMLADALHKNTPKIPSFCAILDEVFFFLLFGGNSLTVYNENQVNYFSVITCTWFLWRLSFF